MIKFKYKYFFYISISFSLVTNQQSMQPFIPEILRLNDSFIYVSYRNIFSSVKKVQLYQQYSEKKLLAEATIAYEGSGQTIQTGGILVQPLEEGKDILLAAIDPCKRYNKLFVSVEDMKGNTDVSNRFDLSPPMFFSEINRWICYEDDWSIHFSLNSQENKLLKPCAQEVQIS